MPTFEEKLTSLEAVVERLERGDLSLDESVKLFEEGVRLSNACKQELELAEGRIDLLAETSGQQMEETELNLTEQVEPQEDED
jgi:exodeoxyribonuclease VII small subunit